MPPIARQAGHIGSISVARGIETPMSAGRSQALVPVSPTSEKPANHTYRPRHEARLLPSWTFTGRLTLVVRAEIGGVISHRRCPWGPVGRRMRLNRSDFWRQSANGASSSRSRLNNSRATSQETRPITRSGPSPYPAGSGEGSATRYGAVGLGAARTSTSCRRSRDRAARLRPRTPESAGIGPGEHAESVRRAPEPRPTRSSFRDARRVHQP
jgi:hypothetical protein